MLHSGFSLTVDVVSRHERYRLVVQFDGRVAYDEYNLLETAVCGPTVC